MQQEPPFQEKLLDRNGFLTPRWRMWFQSLKTLDDQIGKQVTDTYTTSATLKTTDFGKRIEFNNGANPVTCYLPSVESSDIGGMLTIYKLGTGHLRIQAADSDTIGNSTAGGAILTAEPSRPGMNIKLQLQSETKWFATAGYGIWYVV